LPPPYVLDCSIKKSVQIILNIFFLLYHTTGEEEDLTKQKNANLAFFYAINLDKINERLFLQQKSTVSSYAKYCTF